MNLDEIGAAAASRAYPGLIDPLTDAIILVCALLTILLTWRAWNRRARIGRGFDNALAWRCCGIRP